MPKGGRDDWRKLEHFGLHQDGGNKRETDRKKGRGASLRGKYSRMKRKVK